jgi:hypothetical protein
MNAKLRTVLRWLPAIFWMVMIFAFSSQPGGGSGALSRLIMGYLARVGIDFQAWFGDDAVWVLRKCAHFTEYMLLFFWLHLAISTHLPWEKSPLVGLGRHGLLCQHRRISSTLCGRPCGRHLGRMHRHGWWMHGSGFAYLGYARVCEAPSTSGHRFPH